MGILLILSILVVVGALLLFNLFAANLAPSKRKRAAEIQRMREDVGQWAGDLVPLDREELELFSLGIEKQVLKKGISTRAKGIFTTIYHEPVVAYSYRSYLGQQRNDLLYARTADHEYVFYAKKGTTYVEIDGQPVGKLDETGTLLGQRTGKPIARLAEPDHAGYLPLIVGDREIGSLTTKSPSTGKGLNDRAFEFLQQELDEREELLLIGLGTRELVKRAVDEA
jgi:hypothetical protein